MKAKVHFLSLGCPKNTVDTEIMAGRVKEAGATLVSSPEESDLAVVNTCGFIQSAKEESLDAVMELIRLKSRRPGFQVVMAGCLVQRYARELAAELPEVDAFIGVNDFPRLVELLVDAPARPLAVDGALYLLDSRTPRFRITLPHLAYVKVAEGCSHRCRFCAIPAIRGPLRSRDEADILQEAATLIGQGVKELVLIGQDTTAYGRDLGRPAAISCLLRKLAGLEGDFRVRLMYAYPTEIDDDLLETLAAHPRLCRYLDIPLQHADPAVLKGMGRGGDDESFLRLLERIRQAVPGVAVRTTLITGFPGETAVAFRRLKDFVQAAEFTHLGVFAYSEEEGTPAYGMPGKPPASTAEARRDALMRLQRRLVRKRGRTMVGAVVRVLVDGIREDAEFLIQARTDAQAPEVDGVVYITSGPVESLAPGQFAPVRIKRALDYDFEGELLPGKPQSA